MRYRCTVFIKCLFEVVSVVCFLVVGFGCLLLLLLFLGSMFVVICFLFVFCCCCLFVVVVGYFLFLCCCCELAVMPSFHELYPNCFDLYPAT